MKFVIAVAAAAMLSTAGPRDTPAQALGISTSVGLYSPGTALAAASTKADADVRLDAAPAVSAGLDVRVSGGIGLFASVDYATSRLAHTSTLRLGPPPRPYSAVQVIAPVGGLALSLPIPSRLVRLRLRVGGGYAIYRFDPVVLAQSIRDPAAFAALGLTSEGSQRVGYVAEVRCMISTFDAGRLPLRVGSAQTTTQRDWILAAGLRFGL